MKKIRYIIRMLPVLACALALASCDNDECTATGSGGTPLEFRAVIGDTPEARPRSTVDNSFMEDDRIFIDLNSANEPKEYKYHDGRFVAADPDMAWYPDGTPAVKAIYPAGYSDILTSNSVNYEVSADQTEDGYEDADVLYACDISFDPQNSTLQFQHVMAKIVVNIRQGGYTGDADISGVTLSRLYSQTTLTFNDLSVETQGQSGNTDIQAHKSASPAGGMVATFEALVIPGQTISKGTPFATIKVDGSYKDFTYALDKDITFAQGTRYTFNLMLTSEQTVTVGGIEVGGWGSGGTYDL